jgi:Arc/MetJ family transcription regulator
MKLSINIDEELLAKAQQLSKCKTKKATVEIALELLVSFNSPKILKDYIK